MLNCYCSGVNEVFISDIQRQNPSRISTSKLKSLIKGGTRVLILMFHVTTQFIANTGDISLRRLERDGVVRGKLGTWNAHTYQNKRHHDI